MHTQTLLVAISGAIVYKAYRYSVTCNGEINNSFYSLYIE